MWRTAAWLVFTLSVGCGGQYFAISPLECNPGWADLDHDAANGCETRCRNPDCSDVWSTDALPVSARVIFCGAAGAAVTANHRLVSCLAPVSLPTGESQAGQYRWQPGPFFWLVPP